MLANWNRARQLTQNSPEEAGNDEMGPQRFTAAAFAGRPPDCVTFVLNQASPRAEYRPAGNCELEVRPVVLQPAEAAKKFARSCLRTQS